MIDPPAQHFEGRDGLQLAYYELGEGRPIVLLHGFLSTAIAHWVRYRHAATIAALGYRVVMPDLRAHGDSSKPHDPAAYPPDVLADDGLALIEELDLTDYDLGGYSLGARTTVRMLARGATPGRTIVAGMGLEGLVHTEGRGGYFRNILTNAGTFAFGSPEWKAEAFIKKVGGDPVALLLALDTTVDTSSEELARITMPTLVLVGAEDHHAESAKELAAALPDGRHVVVPGDHTSAITRPELGVAMADFLGSPQRQAETATQ
jgi:pimeloyl-ACP methyl ester carboxylesterase